MAFKNFLITNHVLSKMCAFQAKSLNHFYPFFNYLLSYLSSFYHRSVFKSKRVLLLKYLSCFLVFTFSLFSFNDLFISVILQILVTFFNLNARIYVGFPCRIRNHLLPCKVNNKQNNRKLPVLSFA